MKNIKNLIFIIALLISSCSNDSSKEVEDSDKGNESEYAEKSMFNDYNLFSTLKGKMNFVEKFIEICETNNHLKEYDLKNVELENTRRNFLHTYFNKESAPIDYRATSEQFFMGYVYDDSYDCDDCGYILFTNTLIINKTKDNLYYMSWENKNKSTKSLIVESNVGLNATTKLLVTNIDTNLVRKTFSYDKLINPYKMDRVIVKMKYNIDESSILDDFRAYKDSTTYIEYKKKHGKH